MEEIEKVENINKKLVEINPKNTSASEQLIFGIICLEMDNSMTSMVANNFNIKIKSKQDIYDQFTSLCRIPVNYIEFLYSQGIQYIPIFYRLGKEDVFMEQLKYVDGLVMIGGTVYNHFPTNHTKQKKVDKQYTVLNLEITKEKEVRKYPQAVRMILKMAKQINDHGRRFVLYAVCESFMEMVIAQEENINMYVVNNNSKQVPVYFTEFDEDLRRNSFVYNSFSQEERLQMTQNQTAFFFHNFAFYSADYYVLEGLKNDVWPILSFKRKIDNIVHEFSAGFEFKKYPFFGFQFHPEKILQETYLNAQLSGTIAPLNLRFAEILRMMAQYKKYDTQSRLPID